MRRAMVTVARHADLLPDWMSLCSLLGLNQRDIDDIMYRHQGTRERCYESLVCWAQQADDNADCPRVERTVQGLVQLLRKNRHIQLAGRSACGIVSDTYVIISSFSC